MEERVAEFVQKAVRHAGQKATEVKLAYIEGREEARDRRGADRFGLPTTENDDARIVCRRYAERRAVPVSIHGVPPCFEEGSVDCEGCVEDLQEGHIETW